MLLFATVWAATSTTYIVKFHNDAVNKVQKRYNHNEIQSAFYDELQSVLGKDSFTPENSFQQFSKVLHLFPPAPELSSLLNHCQWLKNLDR